MDLTLCYRARDAVLDRPVFVKILNAALAQDAEIRARFEREAKAVARLDHPNLVRIYEYGEDPQEGMYMLLEWVDGSNLAQQINEGKRFAGDDFEQLARELLSGLAALHSVGILHRDLKPENVLTIRQADKPTSRHRSTYKITDFSLAMLRDAPKLTHHEAIVGTPAYMSPEQAAGAPPTEQSDLFSLGVILYEAATGANPLIGETMLDTLRRIRESDISFEHAAIVNLPEHGRTLLERLLKKSPAERPASAEDALTLLSGKVPRGDMLAPRSRRRDRRFFLMAAVVLTIGIILLVQTWTPNRENAKSEIQNPSQSSLQPLLTEVSDDTIQQSIPEFRNPATLDTNTTTETKNQKLRTKNEAVPIQSVPVTESKVDTMAFTAPDSVDLIISTEPWAHVYLHGTRLGTTPLTSALRLPSGAQTLELRNPAFPEIDLPVTLTQSKQMNIRLAEYVTTIRARVEPWGELYIDGEHIGTTPITRPVYISPGRHAFRISHPALAPVQRELETGAGQALDLEVNLNTGTFEIAMDTEERP